MLDIRLVRENPEAVRKGLAAKRAEAELDRLLAADARLRAIKPRLDERRHEVRKRSEEIGALKKQGKDAEPLQAAVRALKEDLKVLEDEEKALDADVQSILARIPNLTAPDVPVGDPTANREVARHGTRREFSFAPKAHWDLGAALGLFDFERGAKLAGSNFSLFLGDGARLVRGLLNFMLDLHTREHGYREVWPPSLANRATLHGTGQLPKLEDDMYRLERDDLFLIPTAEVPVANIYRGEILEEPLPLAMTAYTPCFRREAGAYGRDTRGLLRVHQFDKVELIRIVEPETSLDELERMRGHAEEVLRRLELEYRVLMLATGDLSFASAKTYDLECWAPGCDRWVEVSSVSNCTDFQSRRMNLRSRGPDRKPRFPHLLNGSGVALPRTILALLEQRQEADGSVPLPKALQPYVGLERLAARS